MRHTFSQTIKSILFSIIILNLHSIKSFERNFVSPALGDRTIDLLEKTGEVLNEVRYSIGAIENAAETISESGSFVLGKNIEGNITIAADDVVLDLNKFQVYSTLDTTSLITVKSGYKNISIINGTIRGSGVTTNMAAGIYVEPGAALIKIEDVTVMDLQAGIYLDGADGSEIKNCRIKDCILDSCAKGLVAHYTKKAILQNSQASNCTQAGFEFNNSKFNEIKACSALEISNDDNIEVVGFASKSGQGNLFYQCVAEGIYLSTSTFCTNAIGFLLGGTEDVMEEESKIIECIIDSTKTATTGISPAYGIFLEPKILSSGLLTVTDSGTDITLGVNSVAWSPNDRYLAAGSIDSKAYIFKFNGSSLTKITDSGTDIGNNVTAVAWSYDGKYLAAGSSDNKLYIFEFNGSSLVNITDSGTDITALINSISWSADGKYLAAGSDDDKAYIFEFNGSSLTKITDSGADMTANVYSVAWSYDGKYLAAGNQDNKVYIFEFNGSSLTNITDSGTDITANVFSISWSADNKYLAAAGSSDNKAYIFEFNGSSLVNITDSGTDITAGVFSVSWSADGKYIAAGSVNKVYILQFNGSSLTKITDSGTDIISIFNSIAWSPSGKQLAAGCANGKAYVFSIMNAPSKNVIDGNRICNTSGAFNGIGILGGGDNLFIRNIGYHNDINFSYGVMRTAGLTGKIGFLDNIWVPPYQFYVHAI